MEDSVDFLEAIYQAIVDKFDRFLEYNTTTTQSDYGEMFHCLLDFLRLEVEYDREVWNLTPVAIAHAVLARSGRHATARIWEGHLRNETSEMAEEFVTRLDVLEQRHGMRLPSLADHVHERLVKPLALDRLLALVPAASAEAKQDESSGESFAALQKEIDGYLVETAGAGIDVPPWLRQLEKAVDRVDHPVLPPGEFADVSIDLPPIEVALSDMRRQLESWSEPLVKRKKRRGE
jgi:AcrR family transcriptional regulator